MPGGIDYYSKTIVHNAPARFAVYDWHRNQKPIQEDGYSTDLIADEAVRVIQERSQSTDSRPLFMYVAFNAVHGPLNVPPDFNGDPNDPLAIRDAMLQRLDRALGKIIDAIDQEGMKDDTLLIFTNDNGPVLEEMSVPFRGTKNTTFEGGVRQPAILRWPNHVPAGETRDGMMFIADFLPTFVSLAGSKPNFPNPIDGKDMTAMLFEQADSPRDEIVFDVAGSVRLPTLRKGQYKLMGEMLFDIKNDQTEARDIAEQHPKIVRALKSQLAQFGDERPELGDKPLLMDPPLPYVYGLQEQHDVPKWLVEHVDAIRAKQPQEWDPGETPWPKAPQGAKASKMDGLKDEVTK